MRMSIAVEVKVLISVWGVSIAVGCQKSLGVSINFEMSITVVYVNVEIVPGVSITVRNQ